MSVGPPLPRPGGDLTRSMVIMEPGFRRRFPVSQSFLSRLLAFLAIAIGAGCDFPQRGDAPKPVSQRLTWCGRPAGLILDSALPDTSAPAACLRIQRLEFPGTAAPFRIELRRYRNPLWAFVAWENLYGHARPREGIVRVGSRWAFIHVPYVGLADSSAGELDAEGFRERLAFIGEPSILYPTQFNAFPLLGRIPGSERIFTKDFLGGPWSGPVFSVSYPCHGDTAIAFRTSGSDAASLAGWMQPWKGRTDFAKEKRFDGQDEFGRPMILQAFSGGIVGISGCFDSELGQEYAEKMRKTQVFWHDP